LAQAKTGARIKNLRPVPQEEKSNTKPPPENHIKRQEEARRKNSTDIRIFNTNTEFKTKRSSAAPPVRRC
jgi:hypothetical protein